MLRFFLDKFKESSGPLKATRQVVADVMEELLDIAEHYILGSNSDSTFSNGATSSAQADLDNRGQNLKSDSARKGKTPTSAKAKRKKQTKQPELKRTLDVPHELATALDIPSNKKKQEFKVLAILWDANNRNLGNLSAKQLSEHGVSLGLAIRHENVRKVIRMRLENYVNILQNRQQGSPIYNYKITEAGIKHFRDKYLNELFIIR